MDRALAPLLAKYGFSELQTMASLSRAIPLSMPEASIVQAFSTGFPQSSSLEELLSDLRLVYNLNIPRPLDFTHRFLGPPVVRCMNGCRVRNSDVARDLVAHKAPRQIAFCSGRTVVKCTDDDCSYHAVFHKKHTSPRCKVRIYDLSRVTVRGVEHKLPCTGCMSRYGFFRYYDPSRGRTFYEEKPALLQISEEVYWTRDLVAFLLNSILHAHCTFEAFAETVRTTFALPAEFNRRMASDAFYTAGIEEEIRSLSTRFHFPTREIITPDVLMLLEKAREHQLYGHQCSPKGLARGGQFLYIFDGIWDLAFRHCSMPMRQSVGVKHVNLPPVCTNEPVAGEFYCSLHFPAAKSNGLPLRKANFFQADNTSAEPKPSHDLFNSELQELPSVAPVPAHSTGRDCANPRAVAPWCRKNLGKKKKAGCWSRGYLVMAEGCGNITAIHPLYRYLDEAPGVEAYCRQKERFSYIIKIFLEMQSESLSQVYLIVMQWLFLILRNRPKNTWNKVFMCYDNMCNFDRLKAHTEPLPDCFPPNYQDMWSCVTKIIDGLHLQNHKQERCKKDYNPAKFLEAHPDKPDANTMAAEQTFSWLGKYKKQIASIPKTRQLFYLHRLIKLRNGYSAAQLEKGEALLAPSPRSDKQRACF